MDLHQSGRQLHQGVRHVHRVDERLLRRENWYERRMEQQRRGQTDRGHRFSRCADLSLLLCFAVAAFAGMYFAFLHFYNSSTLILAVLGLAPALWSYIEEPDNPLVV